MDRDTLMNESNEPFLNNNLIPPVAASSKRAPAPPIPARNHVNGDSPTSSTSNTKPTKPSDQPPELPPKSARVKAAGGKLASPVNLTVPIGQPNAVVNKENHDVVTVDDASAPEPQLIQRQKSKGSRRKMTEEEAVQELGLSHFLSSESIHSRAV